MQIIEMKKFAILFFMFLAFTLTSSQPPGCSTAGSSTAGCSTAGSSSAGSSLAGCSTAGSSTAGSSTAGCSTAECSTAGNQLSDIRRQSQILWRLSGQNNVKFQSCEDLNPNKPVPDGIFGKLMNSVSGAVNGAVSDITTYATKIFYPGSILPYSGAGSIPDRKWATPLAKAFDDLLIFYDPFKRSHEPYDTFKPSHKPCKEESQDQEAKLIKRFLDRFMETEVGIRLFWMIINDWYRFHEGDPELRSPLQQRKHKELVRSCDGWKAGKFIPSPDFMEKCRKLWMSKEHGRPEVNDVWLLEDHPHLNKGQRKIFFERLKYIWFGDSAKDYQKRQIAFRHVFVGEIKNDNEKNEKRFWPFFEDNDDDDSRTDDDNNKPIVGFHNWYQFDRLHESEDGFTFGINSADQPQIQPEENVKYCRVSLTWKSHKKSRSTILFGSHFIYDFSVKTLCFIQIASSRRPGNVGLDYICTTYLGNAQLQVRGEVKKDKGEKSALKTSYFL